MLKPLSFVFFRAFGNICQGPFCDAHWEAKLKPKDIKLSKTMTHSPNDWWIIGLFRNCAWVRFQNQNCQIPRLVNLSHTGKSAGVGSSSGTIILSPSVWQLWRLHTSTKPLNAYAPNQHTRKPNDIHIWRVFSGRCSPMMSVHLAQLESFQWIACTKTMRHWFRPLAGSYVTKILGQVWDQSFVQQKSWCIAIYSATKILMHTATMIEQNVCKHIFSAVPYPKSRDGYARDDPHWT